MDDATVKKIDDYLAKLDDNPKLKGEITDKIASAFRGALREELVEGHLVGVDYANTFSYEADVCASHDYCDANMPMNQAYKDVLADYVGVSADFSVVELMGTGNDYLEKAAADLWGEAWDKAKSRGFSDLWRIREMVSKDELQAAAAAVIILPRMEVGREQAYPTPDETNMEAVGTLIHTIRGAGEVADLDAAVGIYRAEIAAAKPGL